MIEGMRRRLLVITAISVASLPACYSWHAADAGPRQYISEQRPSVVRLTLTDGSRVDLERPGIVGQAIVGIPAPVGRGRPMVDPPPVRMPLVDVEALEARRFDSVRTGIAAAVITGALAAAFIFILPDKVDEAR